MLMKILSNGRVSKSKHNFELFMFVILINIFCLGKFVSPPSNDDRGDRNKKLFGGKVMIRSKLLRQFLAETLGTFLLVLFGDGSILQYNFLEKPPQNNFLSVAFGYGFALTMGILVSGGVSGGHLNPAVTLSMCCIKKCRWICLPVYWAGQYLGAFLAAAVLYGIYADGININGGLVIGNAGNFASYPFSDQISMVTLIFDQALGTAVLLVIILSVTDGRNMKVDSGLVPLLIGLGLAVIHMSLAFNAGCAINPARDFAP